LANLGSESETCVGSCVHLVGVSISFEKNFYRLPFTPPSLVRRIDPSRGRRRTAAVSPAPHGIELGGSVSCAECTRAQCRRRRGQLGRRGRIGSGGDGSRLDEAERRGGATPAMASRRYGPQGRQLEASAASSPSCAAPGRLLDGGAAVAAKNDGGGELGFRRLGAGARGG
jgi:hypothetical protein